MYRVMKKRLFVGMPLPTWLLQDLVVYQRYINSLSVRHRLRWATIENLHVTVSFLGYIEETKLRQVIEKLDFIAGQVEPFSLPITGVVYAPPGSPHRMIWLLFETIVAYASFVKLTATAMREYTTRFERTKREVIPHLTLARLEKNRIQEEELPQPKCSQKRVKFSTCALYESHLTESGARYTVVATFPFHRKTQSSL